MLVLIQFLNLDKNLILNFTKVDFSIVTALSFSIILQLALLNSTFYRYNYLLEISLIATLNIEVSKATIWLKPLINY